MSENKQTLLKTPKNLHKEFKDYAYEHNMSVHDAILTLAEKGLKKGWDMDFESLNRFSEFELRNTTNEWLADRLCFLWDIRESDFDTYKRNDLHEEKEDIYTFFSYIVPKAQSKYVVK